MLGTSPILQGATCPVGAEDLWLGALHALNTLVRAGISSEKNFGIPRIPSITSQQECLLVENRKEATLRGSVDDPIEGKRDCGDSFHRHLALWVEIAQI